jgi:hypothetical protein
MCKCVLEEHMPCTRNNPVNNQLKEMKNNCVFMKNHFEHYSLSPMSEYT